MICCISGCMICLCALNCSGALDPLLAGAFCILLQWQTPPTPCYSNLALLSIKQDDILPNTLSNKWATWESRGFCLSRSGKLRPYTSCPVILYILYILYTVYPVCHPDPSNVKTNILGDCKKRDAQPGGQFLQWTISLGFCLWCEFEKLQKMVPAGKSNTKTYACLTSHLQWIVASLCSWVWKLSVQCSDSFPWIRRSWGKKNTNSEDRLQRNCAGLPGAKSSFPCFALFGSYLRILMQPLPFVRKNMSLSLFQEISFTSNLNCSSALERCVLASMKVTTSSLFPTAMVWPSGLQQMLMFSPKTHYETF